MVIHNDVKLRNVGEGTKKKRPVMIYDDKRLMNVKHQDGGGGERKTTTQNHHLSCSWIIRCSSEVTQSTAGIPAFCLVVGYFFMSRWRHDVKNLQNNE